MRIIGGAYRGKKLYSPEYEGVRLCGRYGG